MANITLSADPEVIAKAREVAQRQGKSLNDLVRAYLNALAGRVVDDDPAGDLLRILQSEPGNSRGERFDRDEIYDERLQELERRRAR